MGTQNTPHPDRQSSQPQMNQQQSGKRNASDISNASDPRQQQRGRDVQEPTKPGDDIEQYASDDEDLDARDVTDEWDDSTDSQFASQRNAGSQDLHSSQSKQQMGSQKSSTNRSSDSSLTDKQGQQRSERTASSSRENISSERGSERSQGSERSSSSDKRH